MQQGQLEFTPVKLADDVDLNISCLCSTENQVFIGTRDGRILSFTFGLANEDRPASLSRSEITWRGTNDIPVSRKNKPIRQLEVWAEKGLLFSLCEGHVGVWSTSGLQQQQGFAPERVKSFALDEAPGASRVAVTAGNKVYIYTYSPPSWQAPKIIDLPADSQPSKMVFVGNQIAVAAKLKYLIVAVRTGVVTETMISINGPSGPPVCCGAGFGDTGEEFILRQESKGLTVEKSGGQTRQKIPWNSPPTSICVSRPYVLALNATGLEVSNLFSKAKPSLISLDAALLHLGSKYVFAFDDSRVFLLVPMPLSMQVKQMIDLGRIEDGLKMFMTSTRDKNFNKQLKALNELAAENYFLAGDFDNAFRYFKIADCEPRRLISAWPEYNLPAWGLPTTNNWNVYEFIKTWMLAAPGTDQQDLTNKVFNLLMVWLEKGKEREKFKKSEEFRVDTNVALMKIYFYFKPHEIGNVIGELDSIPEGYASDYFAALTQDNPTMKEHLAMIYVLEGNQNAALGLFAEMASGAVQPTYVDHVAQTVAILSKSVDWQQISYHSQWVARANPASFKSIFVNDIRPHNQLPHDSVLQFLARYNSIGPIEREYLDFIVNVSKSPEPRYHIMLANGYLSHLLPHIGNVNPEQLMKMEPVLRGDTPAPQNLPPQLAGILKSRTNLLHLLKTSVHYDPSAVLTSIINTPLREEKIVLHQRLKNHEKALAIIVGELADMRRAEEYCLAASQDQKQNEEQWTNPTGANPLLFTLFTVCLDSSKKDNEDVPTQAVDLLNRYPDQFDPVAVLKLLPNNIPLHMINKFLTFSMKNTTHKMRHAQVVKSVTNSQLLKATLEKMTLEQQKVFIAQNTICPVTNQLIGNKPFVRFPNGVIMIHPQHEVNLSICPITKRDFEKKPVYDPVL